MRTLIIHCDPLDGGPRGDWSIRHEGRGLRRLTWDEMLWLVAAWIRGHLIEHRWWADVPEASIDCRDGWIRVDEIGSFQFTITHGDKFIPQLQDNEALGFLAAYTLCGRQLFGGLRTYEQHVARWGEYMRQPIAGLLTNQSTPSLV